MPRGPYQRCSQAIFEARMKPQIQKEPLVDARFGLKLETLTETDDGVTSRLVDIETGDEHTVRSRYVIGCDGAGSRVRKTLSIDMIGGPV
jgi:FAD-dependent monooxygenase